MIGMRCEKCNKVIVALPHKCNYDINTHYLDKFDGTGTKFPQLQILAHEQTAETIETFWDGLSRMNKISLLYNCMWYHWCYPWMQLLNDILPDHWNYGELDEVDDMLLVKFNEIAYERSLIG